MRKSGSNCMTFWCQKWWIQKHKSIQICPLWSLSKVGIWFSQSWAALTTDLWDILWLAQLGCNSNVSSAGNRWRVTQLRKTLFMRSRAKKASIPWAEAAEERRKRATASRAHTGEEQSTDRRRVSADWSPQTTVLPLTPPLRGIIWRGVSTAWKSWVREARYGEGRPAPSAPRGLWPSESHSGAPAPTPDSTLLFPSGSWQLLRYF